jgi:cytochrome c553
MSGPQGGEHWRAQESDMKMTAPPPALYIACFVIVISATVRAQDAQKSAVSERELQAKIEYCKTCHGLSGQGYRGSNPMPRLAGQQSEYLEDQLRAFIEGKRTSPFMPKVAAVLSQPMQKALASHFHELNPEPLGGARRELVAKGKAIYEEGVPEANVAPCSSCHGPSAKGDGQYPRLAGQLHDYISNRLARWSRERQERSEAGPTEMESIARSLTESQIFAVAAYVSYLE